jgi:hypothetical protein
MRFECEAWYASRPLSTKFPLSSLNRTVFVVSPKDGDDDYGIAMKCDMRMASIDSTANRHKAVVMQLSLWVPIGP